MTQAPRPLVAFACDPVVARRLFFGHIARLMFREAGTLENDGIEIFLSGGTLSVNHGEKADGTNPAATALQIA